VIAVTGNTIPQLAGNPSLHSCIRHEPSCATCRAMFTQ